LIVTAESFFPHFFFQLRESFSCAGAPDGREALQCDETSSRRNSSSYDFNRFTSRRELIKQNAFSRLQTIENAAEEGAMGLRHGFIKVARKTS
jgi:hypothetical protein